MYISYPSRRPNVYIDTLSHAVVSDAAKWFVSGEGQTSVGDDGLGYV